MDERACLIVNRIITNPDFDVSLQRIDNGGCRGGMFRAPFASRKAKQWDIDVVVMVQNAVQDAIFRPCKPL